MTPSPAPPLDGEAVDWVELGVVSGVFGIKGWIKVRSHTRPREGILSYSRWYLGEPHDRVVKEVIGGRMQGGGVVARIAGCEDRNSAQEWVGRMIAVPRAELAETAVDEYYWRDLIGLAVETTAGVGLGRVREILETGANDVLVLDGDDERLIPFIGQVVNSVDLKRGTIVVDWEGDY